MHESISVVMPYYNDSISIKKAIDSVFSQTLQPIELLVIDDASSDSAQLLYIVNHHNYSGKIKVYRNSYNRNGAFCRNKGISIAKSKYIALLDADDYWLNQHLENSLSELCKNNCDFLYSNIIKEINGKRVVRKVNKVDRTSKMPADILFYSPPQTNSFLFNKSIFEKIRFDEKLRRHQDFQFFLDVINSSYSYCHADLYTSVIVPSHRPLKSRIDFDSMFSFWSGRIEMFTPKLLENYMAKLFFHLLILEPEKISLYMNKYECLFEFRKRKDVVFFEKLGFEKFNLLLSYYFKFSFLKKKILMRYFSFH